MSWQEFMMDAKLVAKDKEIAALKAKLDAYPADWWTDSSLETWFPLTAEELERTKAENEQLKARIAELDWQPITAETLPKVGDEVFGISGAIMAILSTEHDALNDADAELWVTSGWLGYRPMNLPKVEP